MTTIEMTPPKRTIFTSWRLWILLLTLMILVGAYGGIQVFIKGLHITGLSDRVPWGLWITQDLTSIGLGAGAFTFSAIVYLFRIKRFQPLARVAVFIGFLGYTSAMLSLAVDIGRPDRFWHPLVYWNVYSVLWEATWCVILYSVLLSVELLPALAESRYFKRWPWLLKLSNLLHKGAPIIALIGLVLSLLDQSLKGAIYGVLSGRAIWFKPSMPVMFILSAVAGGIAMTLLLSIITGKLLNRRMISRSLQHEVSRLAGYALLAYLYLKLWDWAATSFFTQTSGANEALARLQITTPYSQSFWWFEIFLGGVIPAIILLVPTLRNNDRYTMLALGLVISGVVINRWNVTLSGLVAPPQWSPGILGNVVVASYLPTWTEVIVSIGILGYALMGFSLGVRFLPLYPQTRAERE